MKGFNVYLKAGSQSCKITLATITGTGNDRRQGVKERSNFLMLAVTETHIICHHMGVSVVDVPSHAYDTFYNRKPSIPLMMSQTTRLMFQINKGSSQVRAAIPYLTDQIRAKISLALIYSELPLFD